MKPMTDKHAMKSSMTWTKVASAVAKNQTTMAHSVKPVTFKTRANQTIFKDRIRMCPIFDFPTVWTMPQMPRITTDATRTYTCTCCQASVRHAS